MSRVIGWCDCCKQTKEILDSTFQFDHPTKQSKAEGRPKVVVGKFCKECWDSMWKAYNQSTNLTIKNDDRQLSQLLIESTIQLDLEMKP